MKVAHQKTLWFHSIYAVFMVLLIVALILLLHNVSALLIGLLITAYVIGHVIIHLKRDDLKTDTVIEYVLLAVAVFVVLAGVLAK